MHQTSPLENFPRFRSRDLDESRHSLSKVFCPHELSLSDRGRELSTHLHEADFGHSALIYISYGAAVSIDTDSLGHCYLVQVPVGGSADIAVGSHRQQFQPDLACVVSPSQAMNMCWSKHCGFYTVRLDRHVLEQKLAQLIGQPLQAPLLFDPVFNLRSPAGTAWCNAVEFTRKQLQILLPEASNTPLLLQLEDFLCVHLLQLMPHNYSNQLHRQSTDLTPRSIKRACNFVNANLEQSITLEQLAQSAGVTAATLTRHFQHYLGEPPMKYIRGKKLERVHALLQRSTADHSVTDIALQYGFNHLGRFADYYRRRYGELPSDTLRKTGERQSGTWASAQNH
ncbi:MAG: AraC family transcriptional regulator [Chromatocurvus sp.]